MELKFELIFYAFDQFISSKSNAKIRYNIYFMFRQIN